MKKLLAQKQTVLDKMKAKGIEPSSRQDAPSRGTSWHSSQTGSQPPFSSETPSDRPSPGHQTVPDTLVEDTAPENQEKNQPLPKQSPPESQDDEYDPGEEAIAPPEQVSKGTLMKRLARLCTPREDGSLKLPADVIETYKNLQTRDEVYRSFEKCGCDSVLFSKRINRKYEEINEKSVETEFEFLTEQEMEEKGWSEKKIKGAKKSCEKRAGWKRKSEYCDDYMYWVAVRLKGSNKKTKRNTVAEILEGYDQEPMQEPDEAMEEFPFNLDGDGGDAAKTGGDESSDDDSSDDGEEASRILKKVNFPEVGKKPQDSCMHVATCLQKRSSKLAPVLSKLESLEKHVPLSSSQSKYKDSLKTIVDKLAELEDELTAMYSNGVAVGFTKEDQKTMRARFQVAKTRAVEAEMIFERSKNIKLPANPEHVKQEPKVKAKPKQVAQKAKAAAKKKTQAHDDDDDEENDEKPAKRARK